MEKDLPPLALPADAITPRIATGYPEPFRARVAGRERRALGDAFGLRNFGVNLTRLPPGGQSALLHRHARQDELIYVLEGTPTLVTDRGEMVLAPGMVAGFPANGVAHHLVNRADRPAVYLEIGDRTPQDAVEYPRDDLKAVLGPDGRWTFSRKGAAP